VPAALEDDLLLPLLAVRALDLLLELVPLVFEELDAATLREIEATAGDGSGGCLTLGLDLALGVGKLLLKLHALLGGGLLLRLKCGDQALLLGELALQ
jgi:hypothetical protein